MILILILMMQSLPCGRIDWEEVYGTLLGPLAIA